MSQNQHSLENEISQTLQYIRECLPTEEKDVNFIAKLTRQISDGLPKVSLCKSSDNPYNNNYKAPDPKKLIKHEFNCKNV